MFTTIKSNNLVVLQTTRFLYPRQWIWFLAGVAIAISNNYSPAIGSR
ncbi:hypothetical protein [Microcoleus sp. bin38.metabat.b11b12b14.051]|nr:hypothetical protein [Microcoleus sp. bin38.metabat.b11b12b14.051]